MFQFLSSPAIVQQFSLLLISSAFLFLGLNVAVAWGQSQYAPKTTISHISSTKKSTAITSTHKKATTKTTTTKSKPKVPASAEFSLPDGEYLDNSPAVVTYPRKK